MRIAYFDCFAGASGNMILGALVDAGLSLETLERELRRLPLSGWAVRTETVHKRGLGALYLDVQVPHEDVEHQPLRPGQARPLHGRGQAPPRSGQARPLHRHEPGAHRKLSEVLEILRAARFPAAVEKQASEIYRRLAEAEARVHRKPVEDIVFHEVGQIDAIIDIAGAVIGLHELGIERAYCSPLPCGRGAIECAHGTLPAPSPATLELLRGAPTYSVDVEGELVTPTGAAILTSIASFDARPPMTVECSGYGSGRSDFPFPNVMRVVIGSASHVAAGLAPAGSAGTSPAATSTENGAENGTVVQLETNIDDMNPQLYDFVAERLMAAGALDVWIQPAQMKKGRPGTVLSALCEHERADAVAASLLAETTTIGVRRWTAQRITLPRVTETIDTSLGPVRIKLAQAPSGRRARPEFDDCRAIAEARGMSLADVMRTIERDVAVWFDHHGS